MIHIWHLQYYMQHHDISSTKIAKGPHAISQHRIRTDEEIIQQSQAFRIIFMMIGENSKIVKGWCLSGPFHCSPTDNVLYGEASNFLIDRQPGDPTKEQSQSNFGGFVEEEYYPFTFSYKR